MKEYHKIQSIFLRDPATKHRTFLLWQYTLPVFEYLKDNQWLWTEKVDGTNVRVLWDGKGVLFGGRTNNAQMPVFLMQRLQQLFTVEKMAKCFPDAGATEVMLFGEGYGSKIQKGGGKYIPDGVDFMLFDVAVNSLYLERHNVEDIADKLGIRFVPAIAQGTLAQAVDLVRRGFDSAVGDRPAEGLVLRPLVEMQDRLGNRIITKIKHRDFHDRVSKNSAAEIC